MPARVLLAAIAVSVLVVPPAAALGDADLVQVRVFDPPHRVAAGSSLEVADVVRNRGNRPARRTATGYYLSHNRTLGAADIRLPGARRVPGLRPGRASVGSRTVGIPENVPHGKFHVLACADASNAVLETPTRNNCRASTGVARVTAPWACLERLSELGVSHSVGPRTRGVADPVTVRLPINGIAYYRRGQKTPDHRLFADCSLALALHDMAPTLAQRGLVAVEYLGIYEYRCIAGTQPCELSQHAHATAIDLHEFRGAGGATYNVEIDWIVDPDLFDTCSAPALGSKNALLHELACDWGASNLFNIILTPNYNEAHRNHFHVDLTPGEDYLN
jgi:hypothetical protein